VIKVKVAFSEGRKAVPTENASGANAFEISDIEMDEHRGASFGRLGRNNVTGYPK
jgi:hypothetical protein